MEDVSVIKPQAMIFFWWGCWAKKAG